MRQEDHPTRSEVRYRFQAAGRSIKKRWERTPLENPFALAQRPVVFLDLETTGLRAATDRIIEIGAVRWDQYGRRTYARIVNPGVRVPPYITRLTGITPEMVASGPPIEIALREFFSEFLSDEPVIVAHNAPFDLGFLDAELGRLGLPSPYPGPVACTLRLSRRYVPTPTGRHRLQDVAAALSIPLDRGHRALADVEACERIFMALWPVISRGRRMPWRRRGLAAWWPLRERPVAGPEGQGRASPT
ncbi:MAG: 3'-5' exonuclease [Thermaerobacter sp.]|nr:hypothetical protein [Bacillota bacterium]REJ34173.1 MAG: hypothetical protein DIU84_08050 [Bacillota bacterium]